MRILAFFKMGMMTLNYHRNNLSSQPQTSRNKLDLNIQQPQRNEVEVGDCHSQK